MSRAAEIKELTKMKRMAKTENLLQRESWGLLAVCHTTLALVAIQSTEASIQDEAKKCLKQLGDLAFVLDSPEAKEFSETNALYLSKI